jgi:hypothetical protein
MARSEAKKALEIDPCNSFAHTVTAEWYSPRYQCGKDDANPDKTWKHLQKAVECDPSDGNAWTLIWIESMERGDLASEKKALRKMIESELLTPSLLTYTRWVLESLPQNAILLTNGDQDTYPAVALQVTENLRPDVAIVNMSLLNLHWYARWVRDHYNVPLPYDDKELDEVSPKPTDDGWLFISKQIIRGWIDMLKDGKLGRPLTVAVTMYDRKFYPESEDHQQYAGPYFQYFPEKAEDPLNMDKVKKSIDAVHPEAFAGSFVSARERRALVIKGGNGILDNVTACALRYGFALAKTGETAGAKDMAAWARNFTKVTKSGESLQDKIDALEKEAKKAEG